MTVKKAGYHHGQLKTALFELAEREIEIHGYENLKLQSLTEGLGVQPSAAYRHVKSRDSMLRSLARRGFEQWVSDLEELLESLSPKARAEGFVRYFLTKALERPQMFRLMFVSEFGRDPRWITGLSAFLAFEGALAVVTPDDEEEQVRSRLLASWATLHGIALLLIEGRLQPFYLGDMDTSQLIDFIVTTHLRLGDGGVRTLGTGD